MIDDQFEQAVQPFGLPGPSDAGEAKLNHAAAADAIGDADEADPSADGERDKAEVGSSQESTEDND